MKKMIKSILLVGILLGLSAQSFANDEELTLRDELRISVKKDKESLKTIKFVEKMRDKAIKERDKRLLAGAISGGASVLFIRFALSNSATKIMKLAALLVATVSGVAALNHHDQYTLLVDDVDALNETLEDEKSKLRNRIEENELYIISL